MSHTIFHHTIFHTQLCRTQLCHTHHLSLSHTIFHIQLSDTPFFTHPIFHTPSVTYHLCHIPSFTHNFVTHHLSDPSLSRTIFHTHLCHIPSFTHNFLTHFAWQAWHLVTSTFVSRGRRGTISHPRSFCVAGVALMALGGALGPAWSRVTPRHFAWQACHLVTSTLVSRGRWGKISSTVVLRGRRGTHGTGWPAWARLVARDAAALCVPGVALGDIHVRFTWQAWHNLTSTVVFVAGVAGVALMALGGALGPAWSRVTPRHLAWQAWHLVTSTLVSRGTAWSRVTPRHFAWQAWHLVTSTLVSRGRRGTWRHPPSFCVAGVALIALGWLWCHTPSLSRTIFHTLCHTPSFTHHL